MQNYNRVIKAIVPLTLMSTTCVFAQMQKTETMKSSAPQKEMTQEKKREYETYKYHPQYYDLKEGDTGAYITGEFLYWYARETNLSIGNTWKIINQPTPNLLNGQAALVVEQNAYPKKNFHLPTRWDPGFRAGIGINTSHDGWDVYANYTYFHNHTHKSVERPFRAATTAESAALIQSGQPSLTNNWANTVDNPATALESVGGTIIPTSFCPVLATELSGKWSFYFNQLDFELGRKYWLSKFVNIRPYLGVRGAMTHTNFVVKSELEQEGAPIQVDEGLFLRVFREQKNVIRNKFWGAGLVGGLQPEFRFNKNFMLFGNIDGALLWGRFKAKNKYRSFALSQLEIGNPPELTIPGVYGPNHSKQRDKFYRMQGILDLAVGLRWEQHWKEDRYSTSLDLGWEHHYWFDFGTYHKDVGSDQATPFAALPPNGTGTIQNYSHNASWTTNLGFGGLVFRARFDF